MNLFPLLFTVLISCTNTQARDDLNSDQTINESTTNSTPSPSEEENNEEENNEEENNEEENNEEENNEEENNEEENNEEENNEEENNEEDQRFTIHGVNLPLYVPSSGTEGTTLIELESTNHGIIQDINVHLDLEHSCIKDLIATLTSPNGTSVKIFDMRNMPVCSSNMEHTVLDDQASINLSSGSAPFTGSYQPTESLTNFNGEGANGNWLLHITDDTIGDSGRIYGLSLECTLE